ncbi:altered inheritance of mitochondria protein 21 [Xylogone sp. PMI_703]|nr:altered inheritance of mitochondria protein 21 [Xylogone sp. PMI_703]
MSTAMPQVPPRPTRQDHHANALGADLPRIPPRPSNPRFQRSPSRERFASSPLNEPPSHNGINGKHSTLRTEVESEPPRRPPSVTLPSLGQEGNEYGEVLAALQNEEGAPKETRSVANDLHIHAPKPSLPKSSAEQRVSAVTRTDSGQAAAFGIGKAMSEKSVTDDKEPATRSIRPKASFTSQHSNGGFDRPPSSLDGGEHGIPEIGQRVPMLPFAGDVQAPSPAPNSSPYTPGIGFHNDGSKPRHHGRRTSARGFEGPPGSYGLHGHGVIPYDRFEKAYYEKHPDLYKKECQYNEEKAEWALSSEDLNKVVRETASRGVGVGASPATYGTPTEEIGFQAAEEYASRISRPQSTRLSQVITPPENQATTDFEGALKKGLSGTSIHSETEEEGVIHVDEPGRRSSRIFEAEYGSTDELPVSGTPGLEEEEHGYSAPILAADEVAKEPIGYELQPAVSPFHERKGSGFEGYNIRSSSASSVSGSRPTSRPGSIHGGLPGFHESTPLEDLEEYEPLFPEDDKKAGHPTTQADMVKRPELRKQKFPSQDIWEDTPNSLQYTATVSTPQLPEDDDAKTVTEDEIHDGDTPEQAFARKQEELAEAESHNQESFFHPEKKPWIAPTEEIAKIPRFPSRDVWEDTPDSLRLETTVSSPQIDEKDASSPLEDRLAAHKEEQAGTTTTAHPKPSIPPRPSKAKPDVAHAAHPGVPERPSRLRQEQPADEAQPPVSAKPKPQIPARPAKLIKRESAEETPSKSAEAKAPESKPKPTIPSRPAGGKIAALQNSFMADLNKRLQLGPQAPKKEEPAPEEKVEEKEKVPLADARKGRARGPARRAPTKAAAPAAAEPAAEKPSVTLSLSIQSKIWEIVPEDNSLNVNGYEEASPSVPASKPSDTSATPTEPPVHESPASSESKEAPSESIAPSTTEPEPTVAEPEAPPLAENVAGEKLGDAAVPEEEHASAPEPAVETSTHEQVEKDIAAPLPQDGAPKADEAEEVAPRDPEDTTAPSKVDAEKVDDAAAN